MSFDDRTDAGNQLADALSAYRGTDAVVLALPRGGVTVALPIAKSLSAPMDLLLVRKIGVPYQPEVAMGAVVDGDNPITVRNEDVIRGAGITPAEFDEVCRKELGEIERRRETYLKGRTPVPVAGRIAIVVDDGVATGATLRAALKGLASRKPKKIVAAMPVAPSYFTDEIRGEVDEVICLEPLSGLGAISVHYRHFPQLEDEDVIAALDAAATPAKAG